MKTSHAMISLLAIYFVFLIVCLPSDSGHFPAIFSPKNKEELKMFSILPSKTLNQINS